MNQEETSRRFDTTQHPFYCGIAVHARTMSVGILDQRGAIGLHRHMQAAPETFLTALAPYRDGTVVAVAWMCTWYGLADLCADEGRPFVLGPALSRKAIPGGKATNDPSDAHHIAVRLRGGMLPQASGAPAQMRATRDLLRRRMPLARHRAELLAHVHNTNRQDNLPALGHNLAAKANRDGVAERFAEPAGPKRVAVALALIPYSEALLGDVERTIVHTAKPHDANPRSLRHTVPGIGQRRRLVRLYASQEIHRFPRVQDLVS
jgi:hypothetical protein